MRIKDMGGEVAVHLEALGGLYPRVEPQRRDLEDFCQRGLLLAGRIIMQPMPELAQDGILAVSPHTDDEWEREFFPIGFVQSMKVRELLLGKPIKTGACLLRLG